MSREKTHGEEEGVSALGRKAWHVGSRAPVPRQQIPKPMDSGQCLKHRLGQRLLGDPMSTLPYIVTEHPTSSWAPGYPDKATLPAAHGWDSL